MKTRERQEERSEKNKEKEKKEARSEGCKEPEAPPENKLPMKRKKRRMLRREGENGISFYVVGGLGAALLLILVVYYGLDSSPQKPRPNPEKKEYITIEESKRILSEGLEVLKRNQYQEAETLLGNLKKRMLSKRDACRSGTKEYAEIERILEKVQEAHYHAYKNIKLK